MQVGRIYDAVKLKCELNSVKAQKFLIIKT